MTRIRLPPGLLVGVSGVRGRVGDDLTPEVMARLAACHGALLRERARSLGTSGRLVVLGRDSRTSGIMFRDAAVAGLLSVGCDVVDLGLCPTPTVLLGVCELEAVGGIVITASHNPVEWNAAKLVSARGVFLTPEEGRETVASLEGAGPRRQRWDEVGRVIPPARGPGAGGPRLTTGKDLIEFHIDRILTAPEVDAARVRARAFHVVLDICNGVGGLLLVPLLARLGCRVDALHAEPTGRFSRPPEPVARNLTELSKRVLATKADLGMALDPDGDRLALVLESGEPAGEDLTLALAAARVLTFRPGPPVVTNLSTSRVVEDVALAAGARVERTPVGEIHVAERMRELGSAIGGEGNGGVIYPAVHLTRDAGSAAALILSHLAERGKALAEVAAGLPRYAIEKAAVPLAAGARFDAVRLEALFPESVPDRRDGVRFEWPGERAWLHVRPSGTEPIVRLIAEAPGPDRARALVERARHEISAAPRPAAGRAGA